MEIIMLKGPDRVRKRPAVIFGSDDFEYYIKQNQAALRKLFAK